jgi:hypothetical protein
MERDKIAGVTAKVVWYAVKRCTKQAGIDNLAPHDLRRSCARICHGCGGELKQIQFLLGHASVQTTERYIGCKQKLKEAVNDRFVVSVADDATEKLGIRRIRDCAMLAITSFIIRYWLASPRDANLDYRKQSIRQFTDLCQLCSGSAGSWAGKPPRSPLRDSVRVAHYSS